VLIRKEDRERKLRRSRPDRLTFFAVHLYVRENCSINRDISLQPANTKEQSKIVTT
jgi:hypothetical protein